MERISAKKLPPIFKMSVLWNILTYYGHLHRWRRLLEKINTKTNDLWDQNREQLVYIGRDYKREIELDKLKTYNLRPNRSWLDLFSLSLSYYLDIMNFHFTNLIDSLDEDEVIIIDSHDDIFKGYQIHFWRKDRTSDILPAINCPSFKSRTKIFKTSEISKIRQFILDKDPTKSIVIEKADEKLSINLVYGDTIKITPRTFCSYRHTKFFDKLQERDELWEFDYCACKPKKIRVWEDNFEFLQYTIDELKWIPNINDAKLGMDISYEDYDLDCGYDSDCCIHDSMYFNHSARLMSDCANFIFTGDILTVMRYQNCYNFRLDESTKEWEDSEMRGYI